jgi:hypothetical protein
MAASPTAATSTIGAVVSGAEWTRIVDAATAAGTARSVWMRAVIHAAIPAPAPVQPVRGNLDRSVVIHLSAADRARVIALAQAQGLTISSWARSQLVAHLARRGLRLSAP